MHRLMPFRAKRWRIRSLMIALVLSLAVGLSCWWVAGRLVASANRPVGTCPLPVPTQEITITSQSGAEIAGWYVPHAQATATILLLHPIRTNRRTMLSRAALLYDAGYSTLMIDMQAHGESPGQHITFGHLEAFDARAAVAFARQQQPGHKIAVVGWSLGGAAALLASPLPIDALVVESVYTTIEDATRNRLTAKLGPAGGLLTPVLLAQIRPRLGIHPRELRPIDWLDQVDCPILFLAGEEDHHATPAQTKRLFATAAEPKSLAMFPNAAHDDLLAHDPERYRRTVLGFLADCGF